MMVPSGYGSFPSREALIATSLPRMARRSLSLPSSWATEINLQSRYPGDFDSEDWGGLSIGLSRRGGHVGDHAGQRYNCNQHENKPSHTVPPCVIEPMRILAITDQGSEQASSQAIPN